MHILAIEYLEKGAHRFIEVIEDNKETNEDSREVEMVFDSEEEIKKKLYVKKRGTCGLYCL